MGLRTISQEAFSQAVKDNIEEFDMEPEEAVRSAVEEFQLQGLDLSGLLLSAEAGSSRCDALAYAPLLVRHPVVEAAEAFLAATNGSEQQSEPTLLEVLTSLHRALLNIDGTSQLAAAAAAQKAGVVGPLLHLCCQDGVDSRIQHLALQALAAALLCPPARDEVATARGCAFLCQQLSHTDSGTAAELLAAALSAATVKNEANKTATVDAGLGAAIQHALLLPALPGSAIVGLCELLRRCCNADDDRPVVSRAFQNGRTMGSQGVPAALLRVLRSTLDSTAPMHASAGPVGSPSAAGSSQLHSKGCSPAKQNSFSTQQQEEEDTAPVSGAQPAMQAALCSALKWLVVNEEICKAFAEDGGVLIALQVLRLGLGSPGPVRTAAALLRQLAGSDAIKQAIVEQGALSTITRATRLHTSHLGALEQVLGLLAALTLRNPDGGAAAVEAGCIDSTLEAMQASMASVPTAQWVQRQACQAVRNIAGRCPELRSYITERGAEAVLRRCGGEFPAACRDVSGAALRDLGFDNYTV